MFQSFRPLSLYLCAILLLIFEKSMAVAHRTHRNDVRLDRHRTLNRHSNQYSSRTPEGEGKGTVSYHQGQNDYPNGDVPEGADRYPEVGGDVYEEYIGPDAEGLDNCTHCKIREEVKRLRIEHIKAEILQKLNLERPPNISKTSLPLEDELQTVLASFDEMNDAPAGPPPYDQVDYDFDNFHAKSSKVFVFSKKAPAALLITDERVLYFDYEPERGLRVHDAYLKVFVRPHSTSADATTCVVRLTRLAPPTEAQDAPTTREGRTWVKELKVDVRSEGAWQKVDVYDWMQAWIEAPHTNFGILVEAVDAFDNIPQIVFNPTGEDNTFKAFVVMTLVPSDRRSKRDLHMTCSPDSSEERCCKYHLDVNFDSFGWDWIIVPRVYTAYYCHGKCPYAFLAESTHTHVIQVNMLQNAGAYGPCCAPKRMSSISMVYFDEANNIVFGTLPGMVVERCGCS